MKQPNVPTETLPGGLLGAAMRYCAVADWFESRPTRWHKHMSEADAMALFNRVETELRQAGAKMLRQTHLRDAALDAVGVPKETR